MPYRGILFVVKLQAVLKLCLQSDILVYEADNDILPIVPFQLYE